MRYKRLFLKLIFCLLFVIFNHTTTFADQLITNANVNFREWPSTEAGVIALIPNGTSVYKVSEADDWYKVVYDGTEGYIRSDLLWKPGSVQSNGDVMLIEWHQARNYMAIGATAQVFDVRSGLTYYVRSFSNGSHADVEPVTYQDTQTMKRAFGGRWSWDVRPVLVTVNGRTIAASISGMPHGGNATNHNNGMSGHVCLHFKGSRTHNGNTAHERDHQNAVTEAFNAFR